MEENQNQNSNPDNFNVSGNQKKKKNMGPVKAILLSILVVFLICVIGLLIRMVVAGDGDYFKPVKQIFGIEEEKEVSASKKVEIVNPSFESAQRYSLLSSEVDNENVKHYRLDVDISELYEILNDELNVTDDKDNMESSVEKYINMLRQISDKIDGEMYFDIYFEENEIVQVVLGYDYGSLLENLYEEALETDETSMIDEGIENIDDFADYMVDQLNVTLDEDYLYDELNDNSDGQIEQQLSKVGIKEKDIKDTIEFYSDRGIVELYIYGTTKLKALISMYLESEDFSEDLKSIEENLGVTIDENNIIEDIIDIANETDEFINYGFEFVEVN